MVILVILSILSIFLNGEDIEYSFHLNRKSPYRYEPITLDVNISQLDHSRVMFFKFTPKESSDYEYHQIDFKEDDEYHNLKQRYRYIIYPLKRGRVDIRFNMIKTVTTDESVAYAISGDRDNIKSLVKTDIKIDLEPLLLDVKPLPEDTSLVGDFRLKYNIDKNSTKAYEPIYLHIEIVGDGYLKPFNIIPQNREEYLLFTQKPKLKKGSISWDYAISSKRDFTIPKVNIKAFNPKSKESYYLTIPPTHIRVKPIDKETLLDKKDSPKSAKDEIDLSKIGWILSYIAIFIAGFLTPRDILKRRFTKRDKTIRDEIRDINSKKELLKYLLSKDRDRYEDIISTLESAIYRDNKIVLKEIKEMIYDR